MGTTKPTSSSLAARVAGAARVTRSGEITMCVIGPGERRSSSHLSKSRKAISLNLLIFAPYRSTIASMIKSAKTSLPPNCWERPLLFLRGGRAWRHERYCSSLMPTRSRNWAWVSLSTGKSGSRTGIAGTKSGLTRCQQRVRNLGIRPEMSREVNHARAF